MVQGKDYDYFDGLTAEDEIVRERDRKGSNPAKEYAIPKET